VDARRLPKLQAKLKAATAALDALWTEMESFPLLRKAIAPGAAPPHALATGISLRYLGRVKGEELHRIVLGVTAGRTALTDLASLSKRIAGALTAPKVPAKVHLPGDVVPTVIAATTADLDYVTGNVLRLLMVATGFDELPRRRTRSAHTAAAADGGEAEWERRRKLYDERLSTARCTARGLRVPF
jgi:hypothetical protein